MYFPVYRNCNSFNPLYICAFHFLDRGYEMFDHIRVEADSAKWAVLDCSPEHPFDERNAHFLFVRATTSTCAKDMIVQPLQNTSTFGYTLSKMLSTIRGLWFVVYEYLNSWFVQKPVIRELDPRETIRSPPAFIKTTKKVVHLPVGLPPKCPQCVRSKDERSKLVSRLHHFSC